MNRKILPGAIAILCTTTLAGRADANQAATPVRQTMSHTHVPLPHHSDPDAPDRGISLDVVYTADLWRAASGGVRRGTRYLDNLDVAVEAHMDKLVGWDGATIFLYGLYNNGKSLNTLMGDVHVVSNIEAGTKAARLYEAWLEQRFGDDRASVKAGLYDLNSEFDMLESSSLFIGSAHGIGTDISQSGENGPSIFPSTSLAARLALNLGERWTLRAAVLDGVPGDPNRPKGTTIKLGNGDGALMIAEAERRIGDAKLLFGYWRYTAAFDTLAGGRSKGNDGVYLRGETPIGPQSEDGQGLSAFFRLGLADGRINMVSRFASGGLVLTGPFTGRDEDQLGLAFATAFTSDAYRSAMPSVRSETSVELTYRAPLTDFLTIQPNVQYVMNPSADPSIRNALAIGLRAEISWSL